MLKSNLLNGGSTNIRLSCSAYNVLVEDCFKYGFTKNEKANICYIVSRLIKELTAYRNELHEELLKYNKRNNKVVKIVENSIFNVYQKTLNYICDDSYINIGYRISKEFMPHLKNVFYETLEKFDMDFSSYVRSIIYEYCSREELQRELFLHFSLVQQIKQAIKKSTVVNIVNDGIQNELVLVSIEPTEEGVNYLLGITPDKKMCYFLPLCKTELLKSGKTRVQINQEDYDKIVERFYAFIKENG